MVLSQLEHSISSTLVSARRLFYVPSASGTLLCHDTRPRHWLPMVWFKLLIVLVLPQCMQLAYLCLVSVSLETRPHHGIQTVLCSSKCDRAYTNTWPDVNVYGEHLSQSCLCLFLCNPLTLNIFLNSCPLSLLSRNSGQVLL